MPPLETQVQQLAKQAAELALRLATLPPHASYTDTQALDALEQLAILVLKEVAAVRAGRHPAVGETCGMWPAMQPITRR